MEISTNHKIQTRNIELITDLFKLSFLFLKPEYGSDISVSAIIFIFKCIEENITMNIGSKTDKKISSEEFFVNLVLREKKYRELADLLLYMYENPACALPITSILMKILKNKKEDSKGLILILKRDGMKEVFKQMLKTHDCNSLIIANIICIFYHLMESIELDELFQLITFNKLKEIFLTFRMNGFEGCHESIIYLIKAVLVKKSIAPSTKSPQIETAGGTGLVDSDYSEMIIIFSSAVTLIRNKFITTGDFNKLSRCLYNLLSHIYTICNIINNINEKNAVKAHQVCIQKKIPEYLIDCLATLNEKKVFTCIDNGFDRFDNNSVNTK